MNKVLLLKIAILLLAVFLTNSVSAQNNTSAERSMIQVYVAPGGHTGGNSSLQGLLPIHNLSFGMMYSRKLTERLSLFTGGEFTYNNGMMQHITIPLQLKHHFRNRFYFNHGLLFGIDRFREFKPSYVNGEPVFGNENYDIKYSFFGLGYGIGLGFEHRFDNGISLFANPFLRWNGVFTNRLSDTYIHTGIKLGVGYRF